MDLINTYANYDDESDEWQIRYIALSGNNIAQTRRLAGDESDTSTVRMNWPPSSTTQSNDEIDLVPNTKQVNSKNKSYLADEDIKRRREKRLNDRPNPYLKL